MTALFFSPHAARQDICPICFCVNPERGFLMFFNSRGFRLVKRNILAVTGPFVAMKLSALTQFIANISMALDGGYDIPLAKVNSLIERGEIIASLTDLFSADSIIMAKLFREHWTTEAELELNRFLRDAAEQGELGGSFNRSGLCYLIALTARMIERQAVEI